MVKSQCTITTNDTCIIQQTVSKTHIQCSDSLPNCNVTLNITNTEPPKFIDCPTNAQLCVINCNTIGSCKGIQILATTAKETEINIAAQDAGKAMEIYGPGENGGKLYVNLLNDQSDFYQSLIISESNSAEIIIDCQNGNDCSNNIIDGRNINSEQSNILILCDGPNSECVIQTYIVRHIPQFKLELSSCTFVCKSCANSNVYTINGITDIN